MKTITIGFSKSAEALPIFSWIIMLGEKTNYSHVYLKYYDEMIDRYVYFQASNSCVNYMGSEIFHSQEDVVDEFTFSVPDKVFQKTLQFAYNNVGKPYGVLSIVGLAVVQVASFFGIKMNNPLKEAGKTWICSQLIAEILKNCENIKLPIPLNDITPKDMYEIVSKLPGELK